MRANQIEHRHKFLEEVENRTKALAIERAGESVEPLSTLEFLEREAYERTVAIPWDPEGKHIIEARIMTSGESELYLKLVQLMEKQADGTDEEALKNLQDLEDLKRFAGAFCIDPNLGEFFKGPKASYGQVLRFLNELMSRSFTAGARIRGFREE